MPNHVTYSISHLIRMHLKHLYFFTGSQKKAVLNISPRGSRCSAVRLVLPQGHNMGASVLGETDLVMDQ